MSCRAGSDALLGDANPQKIVQMDDADRLAAQGGSGLLLHRRKEPVKVEVKSFYGFGFSHVSSVVSADNRKRTKTEH